MMAVAGLATAEDSDWQTSWDGTLYGYANSMMLRDDSVLNPYNRIARLPQRSDVAELRLNFKAENETVRLTARTIDLTRELRNAFGTQSRNEGYVEPVAGAGACGGKLECCRRARCAELGRGAIPFAVQSVLFR